MDVFVWHILPIFCHLFSLPFMPGRAALYFYDVYEMTKLTHNFLGFRYIYLGMFILGSVFFGLEGNGILGSGSRDPFFGRGEGVGKGGNGDLLGNKQCESFWDGNPKSSPASYGRGFGVGIYLDILVCWLWNGWTYVSREHIWISR